MPEPVDDSSAVVIAKDQFPVALGTPHGRIFGSVFLRPHNGSGRAERVADLLSDRSFVPVRIDNHLEFVAVRHILYARVDLLSAVDELDPKVESAHRINSARVACLLSNGEKLEGVLRYTAQPPDQRVSDYLESLPSIFPLVTDNYVYLVQTHCLVTVSVLQEQV